jgi:hypothetical protein
VLVAHGLFPARSQIFGYRYMYNSWLFGELYQLGLPLFVPALDLLIRWHTERNLLWETYYWWFTPPVNFSSPAKIPHPHEDSPATWRYWYQLSDYYYQRTEHIQYFDSIGDLFTKLHRADLCAISLAMDAENDKRIQAVARDWAAILERMYEVSSAHQHGETAIDTTIDQGNTLCTDRFATACSLVTEDMCTVATGMRVRCCETCSKFRRGLTRPGGQTREVLNYDEALLKEYGLRAEEFDIPCSVSRESYAEAGFVPRPLSERWVGIEDYPVPVEDQCFRQAWAAPELAHAHSQQQAADMQGTGWWVRHLEPKTNCEMMFPDSDEWVKCRLQKADQKAAEQVAHAHRAAALRAPRQLLLVAHDNSRAGWMLNREALRCAPVLSFAFAPSCHPTRRQHLVRVDLPTYWIANGTCRVLDIAMCPINVPIKNMATNSRIDINATVGASISDRVSAVIPLLTLNGLQSEAYRAAHSSVSGLNLLRRDHDPGRPAL